MLNEYLPARAVDTSALAGLDHQPRIIDGYGALVERGLAGEIEVFGVERGRLQ
jgi:hypothetical protein